MSVNTSSSARQKSKKPKDVFVKQYYELGEECEFDWGEVKLRIGGKPVTFTMAVFALCHSEGRWAYLFRHQDNLAFMESHRNFFHDVHGVPHTMVYDNMKVAVILKPDGKKPTETLLRMCAFYGFGYRFCNARAGWEKGHVERSVDYVRGRAFTTRVDFDSIQSAQQWLSRICDNINKENGSIATGNKQEALRRDMECMLHFPGDFGCFDLLQCTADKQSTISVKDAITLYPTTSQESLSSCSCTARRSASMTLPTRRWRSMSAATQTAHGRLISTIIQTP